MNLTIGIIKNFRATIFLKHFVAALMLLIIVSGCSNNGGGSSDDDSASSSIKGKIEVSITTPRIGNITQYETLNASTVYMLSASVRSSVNGYIRKMNVTPGQVVKEGDVLFSVQSKEAAAMSGLKDTSLHISGDILVKATEAGIVKTIDRQLGDYIQDGDQLCTISNSSSLVFMLDVPFEMHSYVKEGGTYMVILPDSESIKTTVTSRVPEMDKTVQMERYILRASSPLNLPEGLIANVKIPTNTQRNALILPKSAILCDETQAQYWVMKLVHDSLAIKIPIDKGAETKDSVQIKSPTFSESDRILISGNYGLPDTALVQVTK